MVNMKKNRTKINVLDILKIVIIIFTISVLTVNVTQANPPGCKKGCPPPHIISYDPPNLTINDNPPATETFSIIVNQTVNVTWFFDGAVHKMDNSVSVSSDTIAASSIGVHNVTSVARNANGSISQTWTWNVYPPPQIISYDPPNLTINDNPPATETFSIIVNQTVNVTWFFDGAVHKTDNSVSVSSDTITASSIGVHNVTSVARNANGSISQTWTWNVYPPPQIIYYEPLDPIVYDTEPANMRFGITADQDANMSFTWNELYYPPVWWPAGEEFFLNDTYQSAGTYNITFTASNNNGTVSKSWIWIVSP
jgi:uncharacterized Zn finger protein